MSFSEDTAPLDDKFRGAQVVLRAVVGDRVDRKFRANYTMAKYLADRRKIKKIVIEVDPGKASPVEVEHALERAFAGVPHPAVVVGEDPAEELGVPEKPLWPEVPGLKNENGGE
ncbi:hypothetical protein [Mycobacteroides abscessus]|uniref:hypothetical protein n=1 Tax=Mycobacteroides abscessus TaxID=36809 RepID=UPI000372ECC4|nr:hypothetical protein [Mycobacteroides abscessus]